MRVLTDFGFSRVISPAVVRLLYVLGVVVIVVNAVVMILGSALGVVGIGVSINGFDDSAFLTNSEQPSFVPSPAGILLSVVMYTVLALVEIATLRIGLEVAAAFLSTCVAWERIQERERLVASERR